MTRRSSSSSDDLIDELLRVYDKLDADLRARRSLRGSGRAWRRSRIRSSRSAPLARP